MCPPHVAFEGTETIRKFPVLQEVTSDLIIVTITSSLAHHKYKYALCWLYVRPVTANAAQTLHSFLVL